MRRGQAGYTLVEALVCLLVVAIGVTLAASALDRAVAAGHSGAARTALGATLLAGMRQAMLADADVVVCASLDGVRCSGDTDWSGGWIAFADPDRDRVRDPGERLLQSRGALPPGIRLRGTAGRTRIVLLPHGGAADGSNATFTLCDQRGRWKATSLVLANSGRLRQTPASAAAAADCEAPS